MNAPGKYFPAASASVAASQCFSHLHPLFRSAVYTRLCITIITCGAKCWPARCTIAHAINSAIHSLCCYYCDLKFDADLCGAGVQYRRWIGQLWPHRTPTIAVVFLKTTATTTTLHLTFNRSGWKVCLHSTALTCIVIYAVRRAVGIIVCTCTLKSMIFIDTNVSF